MCNSFTSLLANYVYTKHTPLSFASWCMLHIHNSASLRGVCADTPLSFASLVYLLHIHNSAAPRLCIFPYTILSSDVRHYYYILLHIITYYNILLHIITYYYILLHIITYYNILLHIITYYYILLHIITYYYILLHIIPSAYNYQR